MKLQLRTELNIVGSKEHYYTIEGMYGIINYPSYVLFLKKYNVYPQ